MADSTAPAYLKTMAIGCGALQRSILQQADMAVTNPEGELVLVYVKAAEQATAPEGSVGLLPTRPKSPPRKPSGTRARSKKR
jgi:hypothetical protein